MSRPDLSARLGTPDACSSCHQNQTTACSAEAIARWIDSLTEQTRASSKGDPKRAEAMLTAQAHTLDAIFNNLARQAINATHMNNLGCYLKLPCGRSPNAGPPGRRWRPSRTRQ